MWPNNLRHPSNLTKNNSHDVAGQCRWNMIVVYLIYQLNNLGLNSPNWSLNYSSVKILFHILPEALVRFKSVTICWVQFFEALVFFVHINSWLKLEQSRFREVCRFVSLQSVRSQSVHSLRTVQSSHFSVTKFLKIKKKFYKKSLIFYIFEKWNKFFKLC